MVLYPNRSDLAGPPTQPIKTNKGQEFGQAQAQADSQRIQPVAGAPSIGQGGPSGQPMGGRGPGEVPSLSDPTMNPDEPITAGLGSGPGAGPDALQTTTHGPPELSIMRAIYAKYPNEDMRRLIEWTELNLG